MQFFQSRRFVIRTMIISVCVILLLVVFLSWHEMRIKKISLDEYEWADEELVSFAIDEISTESLADDKSLTVKGWCVLEKVPTRPVTIYVVLHDPNTDDSYKLPTTVVKRHDVSEFFNDGTYYDYSGFSTDMIYTGKGLPDGIYDVYLLYTAGEEDPVLVDLERVVAI